MSAPEKPVWVWLPGLPDPVRCGSFTLENRVGRFAYDAAYRARPDALALDPIALPFTRSTRPWSEVRQGGLFGVFRDASPEGFGLAVLEQLRGQNLVEPLQRLEFSVGDAAGAVEVCDDIESKRSYQAPDSAELMDVLARLPEERPSSQAARQVQGIQGTSLGGERPKLTVRHRCRMAFNAIIGNGDDHPRNHGLVYQGGGWTLLAFDIAPYPVFSKTLAMAITRDGSSIASTANLLRNCDNFGYETAEARAFIERAKDVVAREFEVEIEAAGFERGTLGSWNCEWLGE